ncbi:hypothetical protein [Streptomyces mirabilis]
MTGSREDRPHPMRRGSPAALSQERGASGQGLQEAAPITVTLAR